MKSPDCQLHQDRGAAVEHQAGGLLGRLHVQMKRLTRDEASLREINDVLQGSLAQVREMGGILSLCSSCKSIMDDDGTWTKIDTYLKDKTKAEFSHGICPDCAKTYENGYEEPVQDSLDAAS